MPTVMKHGEYVAEIEFDPELEMFFGNVINLSGPVTFYGRSVDELHEAFAASIEVYLDVCRERGIEPEKPYSGRFNIRVPPRLHRDLAVAARASGKSLNAWATEALEDAARRI